MTADQIVEAVRAWVRGQEPQNDISDILRAHKCYAPIKQGNTAQETMERVVNLAAIKERYRVCEPFFKNASFPYAVIKGAVLSSVVCHDPYRRVSGDIDILIDTYIDDSMTLREKIKVLHDAIINNTKYDEARADTNESQYDSSRIQGVLYDHYAICSGYTDIMAVILSKLDVPNYKIASEEHVWNAVYIDNNWYHLDLTWDDPISTSGRDILLHDYFLISDNDLTKLDMKATKREHIYNRDIYLEFN